MKESDQKQEILTFNELQLVEYAMFMDLSQIITTTQDERRIVSQEFILDEPLLISEGESLIRIHLDEDSQQALEFELAPVGCFGGDNTVMTYS